MRTRLLLFFLLLSLASSAQSLMTVRDVFDFNIGDEFTYKNLLGSVPPNAKRYTITDKYYSQNGDTVFYGRSLSAYFSTLVYVPQPHLVYTYSLTSDTVWYTQLDSTIDYYDPYFRNDTIYYYHNDTIYYSTTQCNALINGYVYSYSNLESNGCWREYGQGLGLTYETCDNPLVGTLFINTLVYYKKVTPFVICGTPDITGLEAESSIPRIAVYPNPANDYLEVRSGAGSVLTLRDIRGRLFMQRISESGNEQIDVRGLAPGMYFLFAETGGKLSCTKVVIGNE